jgi:anti-sigma28 factor (negative regulator of flagellin synthesis)
MQSSDDTLYPSVNSPSPRVRTISAQEIRIGQRRQRLPDFDQLYCSSQFRRIYQFNQILTQIFEIREMRVAALRMEIERGHYRVKAEQVAEKILEDQLLEIFYS